MVVFQLGLLTILIHMHLNTQLCFCCLIHTVQETPSVTNILNPKQNIGATGTDKNEK